MKEEVYPLTEWISEAFAFANARHAAVRQYRHGGTIPYLSHLMGVAALVLQHGGDETEAVAALLHDVVEDTPVRLAEVRARFGPDVAAIVAICTDSEEEEGARPPWRRRKERYVARMVAAPLAARRVIAADKLHNAQAIVRSHDTCGDAVWERFTALREEIAWYYRAVCDALFAAGDLPAPLVRQLTDAVHELVRRAEG